MLVSPFTPLFFIDRRADGRDSDYVQTFATTDQILLQIIGKTGFGVMAFVFSEPSGEVLYQIQFNSWVINSTNMLHFATISLSPGLYSVQIVGLGKSEPFRVTDDVNVLEKTTLIQYSMHNNRQRDDCVFFIDNMQYFFDFRVPGGFKDSNWAFGVENEQFVTDRSDIMQLFALDSIQRKFTLGTSQGCPVWFAALLNRLLCCTYVYFDGVRYSRKDSAVPEMSVQLDGVNSFVFTQNLQQVNVLDPVLEQNNQAIMRRVDNDYYRATSETNNRLII